MSPLISVCIANYNGLGIIDGCIRSIQQQTGALPVEILVHDDASTDGSAAQIETSHPQVRLLRSRENVGFCIANNRLAAAAHGEYLLLLNNDAALHHDALTTLYRAARELNRPAILGLPQYDLDTGELLDLGSLLDPFLNPIPNQDRNRQEVGMVVGACLWIPKALWLELGGFPEWFGSIGEDLYLSCRARLAGYPVRVLGTSGFDHRVGFGFGGGKVRQGKLVTSFRRRALSERNKTFVLAVCHPGLLAFFLLPLHLVLIHLEGLSVALLTRDPNVWSIIYAPLIPALWRERNRLRTLRATVQSRRRIPLRDWMAPFRCTFWKLEMLLRHGLPEVR